MHSKILGTYFFHGTTSTLYCCIATSVFFHFSLNDKNSFRHTLLSHKGLTSSAPFCPLFWTPSSCSSQALILLLCMILVDVLHRTASSVSPVHLPHSFSPMDRFLFLTLPISSLASQLHLFHSPFDPLPVIL